MLLSLTLLLLSMSLSWYAVVVAALCCLLPMLHAAAAPLYSSLFTIIVLLQKEGRVYQDRPVISIGPTRSTHAVRVIAHRSS